MRRLVLAVLSVAFLAACQPAAQQTDTLSEEDIAAIKSISPNWAQSFLDCDLDAAAALYAESAVRINPAQGPALRGRDAIRASLDEAFCDRLVDFTIQNMRVDGRGDLAYAWDRFSITTVEGADTVTVHGNWLGVVRRNADGSWMTEIDTPSLETP
jgi:uncharacterized protein (TIGR02246 family)